MLLVVYVVPWEELKWNPKMSDRELSYRQFFAHAKLIWGSILEEWPYLEKSGHQRLWRYVRLQRLSRTKAAAYTDK